MAIVELTLRQYIATNTQVFIPFVLQPRYEEST